MGSGLRAACLAREREGATRDGSLPAASRPRPPTAPLRPAAPASRFPASGGMRQVLGCAPPEPRTLETLSAPGTAQSSGTFPLVPWRARRSPRPAPARPPRPLPAPGSQALGGAPGAQARTPPSLGPVPPRRPPRRGLGSAPAAAPPPASPRAPCSGRWAPRPLRRETPPRSPRLRYVAASGPACSAPAWCSLGLRTALARGCRLALF